MKKYQKIAEISFKNLRIWGKENEPAIRTLFWKSGMQIYDYLLKINVSNASDKEKCTYRNASIKHPLQ